MNAPVDTPLSRRSILHGGLLLGASAVLTGCQSARSAAGLPGPVWPDKERPPAPPARVPTAVRKAPSGIPPGVISRSAWTDGQPRWNLSKPMNGVQRITVHHDAVNSQGLTAYAAVARRLSGIRQSHMARGREWVDIGYHYIIDPTGRVWAGRPVSIEGAHVAATNPHNLGIMVMGNFDEHRPTTEALAALDSFVADQMRRHRLSVGRVYTHQELKPTACPGRNLQRYMLATRARSGRLARA